MTQVKNERDNLLWDINTLESEVRKAIKDLKEEKTEVKKET